MDLTTFEGTWEDVLLHGDELAGHHVRVTVLDTNLEQEGLSPMEKARSFRAWAEKPRGPFPQDVDCSRETLYETRG